MLRASLEWPDVGMAALERVLTEEERARAERYHFKKDRDRFVVARGMLRYLLGHYLKCSPAEVRFFYSQYGKPSLAWPDLPAFQFNLSHSHSLVLYAFTIGRQLGIDIERVRQDIDVPGIARHTFSEAERKVLASVTAESKVDVFFDCWTRKEAYVKARGEGMHFGLSSFDVSLHPQDAPALLRVKDNDEEASRWSFRSLNPHPGYKACLAAEGHTWRLKCWHLDEADSGFLF
ncbi:MAG TPA: 4'-phosphopantetheinyl transferase superfamily protein [Rhodocyclaceae bacterium]|nr:4'-phosphopantetheinyl transferase superfamily protein [Rhodocyclaceae bacterium]